MVSRDLNGTCNPRPRGGDPGMAVRRSKMLRLQWIVEDLYRVCASVGIVILG